MRIFKYIVAAFFVFNLPTFCLFAFGSTMGRVVSILTFILPILYAIFSKNLVILKFFLIVGLSYFLLSGFQFYSGDESNYWAWFIKYLLLVLFGAAIVSDISKKELLIMLIIAASSVVFNAVFFSDDYGRYSGFYLDPNAAGSVCMAGYALSFGFEKSRLKTIAQFLCTFAGLITFSRTFIVLWIIVNLISLKLNPKNIKVLALGVVVIAFTLSLASFLNFNPIRFSQLQSLVGDEEVSLEELNEGSRTATWAKFYPYISEKPVLGHGFGSFQGGNQISRIGPHNSFLLIWGEAGIMALLAFLGLHLYLLKKSLVIFYQKPHLFMMSISLILFLMTNHNYFTAYTIIFISMWIFIETHKIVKNEN